MRDLFRDDRTTANLRGELYAEISALWGLAFALFLDWEGERRALGAETPLSCVLMRPACSGRWSCPYSLLVDG